MLIKKKPYCFQFNIIFQLAVASTGECPPQQFWNGTLCTPCSMCGPGYGMKTECAEKQDTECEKCWLGYDYSNTTGMGPCKP